MFAFVAGVGFAVALYVGFVLWADHKYQQARRATREAQRTWLREESHRGYPSNVHMLVANGPQRAALERLASAIEMQSWTAEDDGAIIFEGDSADGPTIGFIYVDGAVEFLCNPVAV